MLKLLADVVAAAASAPRANATLALLQQLHLLLADAAWRPFVLRWGLFNLTTDTDSTNQDEGSAAAAAAAAAGGGSSSAADLDECMRAMSELLLPEVRVALLDSSLTQLQL